MLSKVIALIGLWNGPTDGTNQRTNKQREEQINEETEKRANKQTDKWENRNT